MDKRIVDKIDELRIRLEKETDADQKQYLKGQIEDWLKYYKQQARKKR